MEEENKEEKIDVGKRKKGRKKRKKVGSARVEPVPGLKPS